ncbi:hypothetical protein L7F22_035528, partial [Adiantum nelumboides]|nr:hypothetical protein [Adiantum nelumboides]
TQFPLDNAPDALESKLLPLGDSITDTIVVVCVEVLAAEQLHVDEEEFKATQAKVEAARMPVPLHNLPSDDPKLKDILVIDEFAARTGGKRTSVGPQSSLTHYLGQLPLAMLSLPKAIL